MLDNTQSHDVKAKCQVMITMHYDYIDVIKLHSTTRRHELKMR